MKNFGTRFQGNQLLIALGLLVVLASCAGRPETSVMTAQKISPAVAKPVTVKPAPVSKLAAVSKPAAISKPAETTVVTPPPPPVVKKAVAPAPPPLPTATSVFGLTPEKVTDMLGVPHLVRRESPAEVWQYAGADCVLHIFLYDDEPSGTFRVDHLDATDSQGEKSSTDTCLADLVQKK